MDWLLERQPPIKKKLAARHLEAGSLVLYDLSWSYFESSTCPLARLGYSRDGKKGKLQVNYGSTAGRSKAPMRPPKASPERRGCRYDKFA